MPTTDFRFRAISQNSFIFYSQENLRLKASVDGENTPILHLQNTVNILDLEGKTTLHEHIFTRQPSSTCRCHYLCADVNLVEIRPKRRT